jgi:hypothetical protein
MRNTVFCLSDDADTAEIACSIERMVDEVRGYVSGYRLKQEVQFDRIGAEGIRLTNFNVEFSCTVSRAALMTLFLDHPARAFGQWREGTRAGRCAHAMGIRWKQIFCRNRLSAAA